MTGFRLPPLPDTFRTTRDHLHQVAFFALAPARHKSVGRMGLRHHAGGFATPEFDGKRLRIEGDTLVVEEGDAAETHRLTTVREAIEFLGHEYEVDWYAEFHDPLSPIDPDHPLDIDPAATHVLGEWFAYATLLMAELHEHATTDDDPSEVQIWPEHFDAATEIGDPAAGQRASYGASPGDSAHAEPYIYVAAWSGIDRSNPYWNDPNFNGASFGYADLRAADDAVSAGLDFLVEGYRILHGG